MVIIVLILVTVGFFSVFLWQQNKLSSISNSNTVSTTTPDFSIYPANNQPTQSAPQLAKEPAQLTKDIDYSALEKDRLYTEEEGKYENLSDAGKKLLRMVLMPSDCINNSTGDCYEYEEGITHANIVSLKNNILMLSIPTVKGVHYKIYDLTHRAYVGEDITLMGNTVGNDKVIVFVRDKDILYYKPSMKAFEKVEGSELRGNHTYVEWYGLADIIDVTLIDDKTIKATVFDNKQFVGTPKNKSHKKVEEKILVIK